MKYYKEICTLYLVSLNGNILQTIVQYYIQGIDIDIVNI